VAVTFCPVVAGDGEAFMVTAVTVSQVRIKKKRTEEKMKKKRRLLKNMVNLREEGCW
jgi:hypothetical protein